MDQIARQRGAIREDELSFLHAVVAEWQLLADLSFNDLLLWVPQRRDARDWPSGHVVIAQIRPTTGSTVHPDDLVGYEVAWGERATLDRALSDDRIERDAEARWKNGLHIVEEAIPVRFDNRTIAVITRHSNALATRSPSRLELTYLQTANDLATMIADGAFPSDHTAVSESSPRVGDGLIRLDSAGRITYASPNAASALRRLGIDDVLDGAVLGTLATLVLIKQRVQAPEESWTTMLSGRVAGEFSIETGRCVVDIRVLPLTPDNDRIGAIVLIRDVTEIRRRERELITKNATIREIHHRVKNNLQTVGALLRLQSRRVEDATARQALNEAVQRVAAIAMVHETLSSSGLDDRVDFDQIVDGIIAMVGDVGATQCQIVRSGTFGQVSAREATALSMVITELIQNALEHAVTATKVYLLVDRDGDQLSFSIRDDGPGFPNGFKVDGATSLGLHIVTTLVTNELNGELTVANDQGAEVSVRLVLVG